MMALRVAGLVILTAMLGACLGSKSSNTAAGPPPPTANVVTVTVDGGPAAATGQINHLYVSVKVCASGSQSSCATIDHVLLDTGSVGLRLVRSVLAAQSVTLSPAADAQGQGLDECVSFGGGQTWGPVAIADVTMAGEVATKVPMQILDDTASGAPAPGSCGANGTLINDVASLGANGILGVGVFTEDCGSACVAPAVPLPIYYGCSAAGVCSAENIALSAQVANVAAKFATDNNGLLVKMPNLVNANGDAVVQGELIFGLSSQSDNALPAVGLTVLGTDANGDFTATYNGSATVLPALIDSGSDDFGFDDPSIAPCSSGPYIGFYCPAVAPQSLFAVNSGVGANNGSSTVNFAITDPNSFVAGASAFGNLGGGGGSTRFTWGTPFFYGRTVYVGFDQRSAAGFTGPYFAY